MPKSRQTFTARVSQATGRRRKKPTSRVERTFEDLRQFVSDTSDRLLSRSGASKGTTKQSSASKTALSRKRSGQQRQAAAKKVGASRIRRGQQRQAATKKAARSRGVKTS